MYLHINGQGVFIKLIQKKNNIIYPLNELEQKGKAHLVWLTHPWSSCFTPSIPHSISNAESASSAAALVFYLPGVCEH